MADIGEAPQDLEKIGRGADHSPEPVKNEEPYSTHGTGWTLETLIRRQFSSNHLDRALNRSQITAIAFAGTIGIGAFSTSGELIAISGSVGNVLAFVIAGFIVVGVMRSLAELVSVRPVEGALMDYPHQFVDEALGFAVGVIYWASECISCACLTAGAARVANNFSPDKALSKGKTTGVIVGLWTITLLSNLCGVRLYGNLERVVKAIKFLIILALFGLMIAMNLGAGGYPTDHKSTNITMNGLTPGMKFDGFDSTSESDLASSPATIRGSSGRFLAIWTAATIAIFSCQGGDLVIVAAGEAKNPRRDLPPVTRFMYLVPLICYVLLAFVVGFNINYADPALYQPWQKAEGHRYPSRSPFVIVLLRASLNPKVLPVVFEALFMFTAYTAANTALYAASRTLYSLSQMYGAGWMRRSLGRTSVGNTPQAAIITSSVVGFLAFLGLIDASFDQPIQSLAAFFTSGLSCVYVCECLAFLRFMKGLEYQESLNIGLSRNSKAYTRDYNYYRAHWQPTCAIVGLVGSCLIVFFSGWPAIYIMAQRGSMGDADRLKSNADLSFDLLGAYLAPVLFGLLYMVYKISFRTTIVDLKHPDIRQLYQLNFHEEPERPVGRTGNFGWWVRQIWKFVK